MHSLLDEVGQLSEFTVFDGDPSRAELEALIADAAIVLNGHTTMDDALLARAPQLRSIIFLGTGGVGTEMARIANGFGMNVVAWNRSGLPSGVPARAVDLDELLTTSDAVSLHLALTPETKGLLGTTRLAKLKHGALMINTARGALINETALIAALKGGRIAHAALDVFDAEPLPAGHPLTLLDNVTLTAHAGWKSRAASRRLLLSSLDLAAVDARKIAAGQLLSA